MNLGMPEMLFIGLLALIIFGPRKLPEIGRQLGRGINEFKRATSGVTEQLNQELRALEPGPKTENGSTGEAILPATDTCSSVIARTRGLLAYSNPSTAFTSTEAEAVSAKVAE